MGSLVLLLPGSMGIDTEGEACVVVAQHAGHVFHVYAVLQGRGGESMRRSWNLDAREPGVF